MNETEARKLCQAYLDKNEAEPSALLEIGVEESKRFWFFRWNSREAVESNGARGYRKTPWIAVEKATAKVHVDDEPPPVTWPEGLSPETFEGAQWIAQARLDSMRMRHPCSIDPEYTQGRAAGWLFCWNTDEFLRTRDLEHSVGGNGPLFVLKTTGEIIQLGTASTAEAQLKKLGY